MKRKPKCKRCGGSFAKSTSGLVCQQCGLDESKALPTDDYQSQKVLPVSLDGIPELVQQTASRIGNALAGNSDAKSSAIEKGRGAKSMDGQSVLFEDDGLFD